MSSNISLLQRAHLLVLLLALFLGLPVVAAGTWLIYEQSAKDKQDMLSERGPLVIQLIENDILAKKQALHSAATLLEAERIDQVTQHQLDGIVQNFSGVIWAGVTDTQGTVLLSYQDLIKGANVSKRPWFQEGLKKESVLDRHDAVLLAKLLPQREDPYRFIDIAVPIHSSKGETIGVLALHLDWIWYQHQFPGLIGNTTDSASVSYAVFGKDNELRLLKAASMDESQLANLDYKTGIATKLQENYYFFRQVGPKKGVMDELDWTLYVLQNKDVSNKTVFSSALFAFFTFLTGLIAATLLFLHLAKRVSRTSSQFVDALVHKNPQNLARLKPLLPTEMIPLSIKAESLIAELKNQRAEIERALSEVRRSYMGIQLLIAQAPIAIAMFDRQMNYLVCSELWRNTYLPDTTDPAGRCHYDLIPNLPDNWKLAHQAGMDGSTVCKKDDCWTDGKGNKHWLDWTVQPWITNEDSIGGVIIITEDVTEANQAKLALAESEERYHLAMQGSHDGLWDWNMQTDRIYFSPSWKSMLGYAPHELKNCFATWEDLLHREDLESAKKAFSDAIEDKTKTQYTNTFRMMHRQGHCVSILSRGIIVRDEQGNPIRTVGTHLDRTEIIALQGKLDEAWLVAQAEARANEAKSKFLATVSHEIRNPLNAVCGFARLIEDEVSEPELKRHAQLLGQTASSLNTLLNDLLDFAKIDLGKLEIINEPFDLSTLLESLSESTQLLCRNKKLGFEFSKRWTGSTGYVGDAGRIRQIIQNLLSNAIKFTHVGQITLRVSTAETSPNEEQVTIEVEDTGIGMPNDRLDRLFKPFSQINSETYNQYGGAGLGLSIVKSLTELMGGKVAFESREGAGSKFSVVLQLRTCQEAARNELGVNAAITPRKVLIADDSPTNLKILSLFLSKRGHQVVCAADGNQAVEHLHTKNFDYVILDMDMPGQSGLQVVSQIKHSASPSANAVFACLSGHADKSSNAAAFDKGFDKFFAKPVDWDEILRFLQ